MKEVDFSYGRMSFSHETLEMIPSLPAQVEMRLRLFQAGDEGLEELPFLGFEQLAQLLQLPDKAFWFHLSGTIASEFWQELATMLELTQEQVKYLRGPHKRSFFEEFHNGIFCTVKRPVVSQQVDAIETINFYLLEKVVVTRQFSQDNVLSLISHKLMEKGSHFKGKTADRLAAELLQDVIDSYVEVLQVGGTRLEEIQNQIIRSPGKKELLLINRAQQLVWIFLNFVWPIETVVQAMLRSTNPVVSIDGKQHLLHRLNEAQAVVKLFETYRAMSYNLMDVYVSGLSLRTNETTMVLTVIATLFLPPSLIAGIYGMNFNIPEVHVTFGYYLCLAAMVGVSGGLLWWLHRRGFIEFGN
jgi:magnesium transporter